MQFIALKQKRVANLVMLQVKLQVVSRPGVLFSDCNATRSEAVKSESPDVVRFNVVKAKNQFQVSRIQRHFYQAEVLVPSPVPPHLIVFPTPVAQPALRTDCAYVCVQAVEAPRPARRRRTSASSLEQAKQRHAFKLAQCLVRATTHVCQRKPPLLWPMFGTMLAWVASLSGLVLTLAVLFSNVLPAMLRPPRKRLEQEDKRPPDARCEMPLRDRKKSCEHCLDAGAVMNCQIAGHMPLCAAADIWTSCSHCDRLLCSQHFKDCYCTKRLAEQALILTQGARSLAPYAMPLGDAGKQ